MKKKDYIERKYLLIGILVGAIFGFLGSMASGYYFWGREHPEEAWMFFAYLFAYVALIGVVAFTIYEIEKKLK